LKGKKEKGRKWAHRGTGLYANAQCILRAEERYVEKGQKGEGSGARRNTSSGWVRQSSGRRSERNLYGAGINSYESRPPRGSMEETEKILGRVIRALGDRKVQGKRRRKRRFWYRKLLKISWTYFETSTGLSRGGHRKGRISNIKSARRRKS